MPRGFALSEEQTTDRLASTVIDLIQPGMVVGLGSGRTAKRAIAALARRVKEGLNVHCVSTSEDSEQFARSHGLNCIEFANVERVNLLFDGADEVDAQMRMLKGAGGAMTRERMVAWASERRVYMVQDYKVVESLGTRSALAVAVMAFGLASVRAYLRQIGLNGVMRRTMKGDYFITDNGNLIIDVTIGTFDVEDLAVSLNAIPGVIDHGLFLREADELFIESENDIRHLVRDELGEAAERTA